MARIAVLASFSAGAAAFAPAPVGLQAATSAHIETTRQQAGASGGLGFMPGGRSATAALGGVAALSLAVATQFRRSHQRARVVRSAGLITKNKAGESRFVVDGAAMPAASATEASMVGFPQGELGVQAPTGFWDPVGFCDGISEMEFKKIRSAEIKHGRLAMMATIGYLYPIYGKLPGYLSPSVGLKFSDVPTGLAAVAKVPAAGWCQILLFAAAIEFGLGMEEYKKRAPGDYGQGFLGMFGPVTDPEKKKRSLNSEIANGRLAMVAITGMVIQEGVFGPDAMWYGS